VSVLIKEPVKEITDNEITRMKNLDRKETESFEKRGPKLNNEEKKELIFLTAIYLNFQRKTAKRFSDLVYKILKSEKITKKEWSWFKSTNHRYQKKVKEARRKNQRRSMERFRRNMKIRDGYSHIFANPRISTRRKLEAFRSMEAEMG